MELLIFIKKSFALVTFDTNCLLFMTIFALVKVFAQILFSMILLVFSYQHFNNLFQFVDYKMNEEEIILEFCVNKDKPEMQCDGKCHLAKKMSLEPELNVTVNSKTQKKEMPRNKIRFVEEIYFEDVSLKCCSIFHFQNQKVQDSYLATISEEFTFELIKPPGA